MLLDEIGARIKQRRLERGWTVRDLARRAGVSASYISLIENGQKVPTPRLAEQLAGVLEDDPQLYLAWAGALRQTNLSETSRVIREYEARLRSPEVSVQIVTPEEIRVEASNETEVELPDSLRNWLRAQRTTPAPESAKGSFFGALRRGHSKHEENQEAAVPSAGSEDRRETKEADYHIPLFLEGVHPSDSSAEMLGTVRIKESVLPPRELDHLLRPFAWRLSGAGAERVEHLLRPRDLIVISEDLKQLESGEVFAVRHNDGILLSRILQKGNVTLLLSSKGESDIEVLEKHEAGSALIGRVALVIRAWHYAIFSPGDQVDSGP